MINKEANCKNSTHAPCLCKDLQGLFVPNRLLSAVVAGLLFLFFASFMTGYFFGKRHEVQQLTDSFYDNAFNDHISASAISIVETQQNKKVDLNEVLSYSEPSFVIQDSQAKMTQEIINEQKTERYRAALIGFSTEKAAQRFAEKLTAKGIEVEVVTRSSKTAKGQTIHWYQVITSAFDNKNELTKLVDRLVKEEKLKDVRVFTSQKIDNTYV